MTTLRSEDFPHAPLLHARAAIHIDGTVAIALTVPEVGTMAVSVTSKSLAELRQAVGDAEMALNQQPGRA
jgi:hypothetical protein